MKKVWSVLLALWLMVSLTACGAKEDNKPLPKEETTSSTVDTGAPTSKEETTSSTVDADAPTFTVDSATAKVGETFTVAVRTENNPGIIGFKLLVDYDTDVLELVEANEQDFSGITYGPMDKEHFVILWVDAIHPDNTTNGVVSTLTFRVRDGAPQGKTELSLSYDPEDVFNAAWENIAFETRAASVTVEA